MDTLLPWVRQNWLTLLLSLLVGVLGNYATRGLDRGRAWYARRWRERDERRHAMHASWAAWLETGGAAPGAGAPPWLADVTHVQAQLFVQAFRTRAVYELLYAVVLVMTGMFMLASTALLRDDPVGTVARVVGGGLTLLFGLRRWLVSDAEWGTAGRYEAMLLKSMDAPRSWERLDERRGEAVPAPSGESGDPTAPALTRREMPATRD